MKCDLDFLLLVYQTQSDGSARLLLCSGGAELVTAYLLITCCGGRSGPSSSSGKSVGFGGRCTMLALFLASGLLGFVRVTIRSDSWLGESFQ